MPRRPQHGHQHSATAFLLGKPHHHPVLLLLLPSTAERVGWLTGSPPLSLEKRR